jgi:hypothetical protein
VRRTTAGTSRRRHRWSGRPLFKRSPFLLAPAAPPRHLRHHHRAPPPPTSHGRATTHAPFLDPIGPSRATCCPGRALVVAGAEPPRSPPPVFAVPPRRRVPRLNSGHPQDLGEHMVMPYRFSGREHGWLAGIRPAPPPPHGRGPDCKPLSNSRVFSVNQGCFCEVSNLCRGLGAKE